MPPWSNCSLPPKTHSSATASNSPVAVPGAVENSPGALSASVIISRWLGYLAMALLVGGFVFVPLILQPALAAAARQTKRAKPAQPGESFSEGSRLFPVLV